tara:strand:- start:251 stop:505 length:255 start_codon:yes stop_codon:yes gene_type:complete
MGELKRGTAPFKNIPLFFVPIPSRGQGDESHIRDKLQTPRGWVWVGKEHTEGGGRPGENKKRGFYTPPLNLTNINSEAGQALDH